jgi:hypothetical protein
VGRLGSGVAVAAAGAAVFAVASITGDSVVPFANLEAAVAPDLNGYLAAPTVAAGAHMPVDSVRKAYCDAYVAVSEEAFLDENSGFSTLCLSYSAKI